MIAIANYLGNRARDLPDNWHRVPKKGRSGWDARERPEDARRLDRRPARLMDWPTGNVVPMLLSESPRKEIPSDADRLGP
jgi:hypothetical protein